MNEKSYLCCSLNRMTMERTMEIKSRLATLRQQMEARQLSAFIVPSTDPHSSEYVSEHWKSRAYFSGFTGSAGTLVVTESESGLWTDGRYYIQAAKQLEGSEIKLFKMGQKDVPSYMEYLVNHLSHKQVIGLDGRLFAASTIQTIQTVLKKRNIEKCYGKI